MERLDHAATAKGLQEARRPGTDLPSRLRGRTVALPAP